MKSVFFRGREFLLRRETRWSKEYVAADKKAILLVSRFEDGTAEITLDELRREWASWSEDDRWDFCCSIGWLPENQLLDIYRFLVLNADFRLLHNVAMGIASGLRLTEAETWLRASISQCAPGEATNYLQALAFVRAPSAVNVIEERLNQAVASAGFAQDAQFQNWVAAEAVHSVGYLIELGRPPSDFASIVPLFRIHKCAAVRDLYARELSKHYGAS